MELCSWDHSKNLPNYGILNVHGTLIILVSIFWLLVILKEGFIIVNYDPS